MMLGDGGAALDPIAAIDVMHAEGMMHRRMVDVAADHAFNAVTLRFRRQRPLKIADVTDGILHLKLGPKDSKPAPDAVEQAINHY